MPGFNGTGPRGMGPMTGGGRGFCSPRGGGRGYGSYPLNYAYPYYGVRPPFTGAGQPVAGKDRRQELALLKDQASQIKGQLEEIETRIRRLTEKAAK